AIITLALGIGANTAIFSVAHGVLLRPLPYPDPGRIVEVSEVDRVGHRMRLADPNFRDFQELNHSLAAFARWAAWPASVSGGTEPVRIVRTTVSGEFFSALGVAPALGRSFAPQELQRGAAPSAVVSDAFWRRYLSGERDLARLNLRLDGNAYRVVGVMPPGFQFPPETQIWTARSLAALGSAGQIPAEEVSRTAHNWRAVGRLREGVSPAAARADLQAIGARIRQEYGDRVDLVGASVVPLKDALVGRVRPALLMLLAAAGLLMLVAGANVTNLALARTTARRRELAIRAAIGASRWDLTRIVFAEVLVLALAGSVAAVLLSAWSLGAVRALSGASLPRMEEITIDPVVLAFAAALAVACAFLVALAAARRNAQARFEGLTAGREGGAASRETMRSQSLLLGIQAAMTALLLAGLALFARSFLRVLEVEPGFRAEGILAMDLFPPDPSTEADRARRSAQIDELVQRLSALPGVEKVGAVGSLPLGSEMADGTFLLLNNDDPPKELADFERLARDPSRARYASYCPATGTYFQAMGIPLVRGRLFDERDAPAAPHAALISEALARSAFAGKDPIGQRIEFGNMDGDTRPLTVVGIVGDVRPRSLEARPEPIVYVAFRQRPQAGAALSAVLRIRGNPASVAAAAATAVRQIDPTWPPRFRPLDRVVADSLAARRFSLSLLAFFGGLALLLAAAGIAGATAFAVARRRPEIGIRLALGANPSDVLRLLLSRYARVLAAGAAAGFAAAAVLARFLQSQLYGVAPVDPGSFAVSAVLLLAVGMAACAVPARQAMRVDPTEALRSE
ncbi:MAG TPA: ADOP family duplicated permease, partial [Thermoanaerobaculia bacterium]|nr:ADOP family duplicated permease [Thermoanaerobaculia bacterium]